MRTVMGGWWRRLVYLLRQSRHDADLREEIEAHRAMRAADLERDGMTPADAAAASRRALGNALLARDDARDMWLGSLSSLGQDVRFGLRTFRRKPGFAASAIVTLALGIGVNAGIFTVVNAILLRPVTAPRAHELVSVKQAVEGVPALAGQTTFSTADYVAYRDRARTLSGLAAFGNARGESTLSGPSTLLGAGPSAPLGAGTTPRKVLGALVSCNFFAVLEQPPAIGRPFSPADCERDAALVVVLSDALWRTAFGGDTGIIGRTIHLNRQPATVVGVGARDMVSGSIVGGGYVAPLTAGRVLSSGDGRYDDPREPWLTLVGRRREGVTVDRVRAEFAVIAAQIDRQQPGRSTTLTIDRASSTDALPPQLRGGAARAALVVMAAFGLILLIACANVANLLLARAASRAQEIGVRVSIGASRGRLIRQLLTESVLLSAAGGLVGSLTAVWSFKALVGLAIPAVLPPWFPLVLSVDLRPDLQVLGFAIGLTLVTGLLFGLAPALHASQPDLHAIVKHDGAGAGSGGHRGRLRGALVGVQVALCMMLIIAAGLLLRGLHATYTVDPGFSYRQVAMVVMESAFDGYTPDEVMARRNRLLAGFEAIPGVTAVATADHKPIGDDRSPQLIRLPGESEGVTRIGEVTSISSEYFSVLDLPIVRGRAFTIEDAGSPEGRPRPAIVSAATAANLWPGQDAIGRTFAVVPPALPGLAQTLHVVGVAADAQLSAIGRIDAYSVYLPADAGSVVLVRGRGDVATTIADIRAVARAVDSSLMMAILPLEATLGWSRGIAGTVTLLFGGLGVLALMLAAVGIYGLVAYAVAGRHREIGIRLALGATVRGVLALVLRGTMRPVVTGAAVGLAGAAVLSRVLTSVLFGISPADPIGLGGSALLVIAVAMTAAVMGARPALRADVTAALRGE